MDWLTLIISTALKMALVLAIIFSFAPVMVWAERRQSAMIQDRMGPNRAGFTLPMKAVRGAEVLAMVVGAAFLALFFVRGVAYLETGALDIDIWLVLLFAGAAGLVPAALLLRRYRGHVTVLGLLQPIADAMKMAFKEDFVPPKADKILHALAPIISLTPAIAVFAVIPFADTLYLEHAADFVRNVADQGACVWVPEVLQAGLTEAGTGTCGAAVTGTAIPMQVASLNVGILFIFAMAGTGVVGAAIAGYSSDNKYSLIGGLRAAGQMVSYEVTLGLTVIGCFMIYGSLLLEDMARWQSDHVWGIFVQPLGALLYFTAAIAETKRVPFDVPEGESEIVGGYFTEYSSMKFGMFMTGEFIEVVALSALASTLFLGGYNLPFLQSYGFDFFGYVAYVPHGAVIALQVVTFVLKLIMLVWFQLMLRWTLPRLRYDQIMDICWKYLLPLSLLNILVTGIVILLLA